MRSAGAWLALAAVGFAALACETAETPAVDGAAAVEQVTALLARYREAFAARDEAAIRSVYVADDRFAWHEDGALRYRSVDEIVAAVGGLPPGMSFESDYGPTDVVLVGAGLASVRTQFETVIRNPDASVYRFGGTITMLVEKAADGWKVVSGHTSTVKSR